MQSKQIWKLFIDGAARHNPGPAGAGIYLVHAPKTTVKEGFFLGHRTNNQAEYLALLIGIILAKPLIGNHKLHIASDSLLLVNQLKGLFKVKNHELQVLHQAARIRLQTIDYSIEHVMRSQNQIADEMANLGIDQKIAVPFYLKKELHEIEL